MSCPDLGWIIRLVRGSATTPTVESPARRAVSCHVPGGDGHLTTHFRPVALR